jgi:hypothetical protein
VKSSIGARPCGDDCGGEVNADPDDIRRLAAPFHELGCLRFERLAWNSTI